MEINTVAKKAVSGETILDLHARALPECEARCAMTLLTGYAEGADRISAAAWRTLGLGGIHAVFPFASTDRTDEDTAWTHRLPENQDKADSYRVDLIEPGRPFAKRFEYATVLDGDASQTEKPPRSGHLEQTRFLSRWADICVVAWDGGPAGGPGGTADLVAFALAKHRLVIWVDISGPDLPVRLIAAEDEWSQLHFGEFVDGLNSVRHPDQAATRDDLSQPFEPSRLEGVLERLYRPPTGDEEPEESEDEELSDLACMRRYTSGVRPGSIHFWPLADTFGRLWSLLYKRYGSPRELPDIVRMHETAGIIETHFAKADAYASRIGHAHRGTQLAILLSAPLAVASAIAPAVAPELKIYFVMLELGLILLAFYLHRVLEHQASHRIWSDARRLAERLRILRATWPLGFDIADTTAHLPETWAEWVARAVSRAAGPPQGVMWAAKQAAAVQYARYDPNGIVAAQVAYQKLTEDRSLNWHAVLEKAGKGLAIFLIVFLALFTFVYWFMREPMDDEIFHLVGVSLMVCSVVIPVMIALFIAIEAKFGLNENGLKAAALSRKFERIETQMTETNSKSRNEELLQEAGWIMLNDVDQWRDGAVRRSATSF